MLEILVYGAFFFLIPAILLAIFGVALYRFILAKRKRETSPDAFSDKEIKKRKIILIISSVAAGVFLAVELGVCILLYMAVAYM